VSKILWHWGSLAVPWVFAVIYIALGAILLGVGLSARRPVVVRRRLLLGLGLWTYVPFWFKAMVIDLRGSAGSAVLLTTGFVAFFAVASWWFPGYIVYGVKKDDLWVSLRNVLVKLELPFEESEGSVQLNTLGARVRVSVRFGNAQLRIWPRHNKAALHAIVEGLTEEFINSGIKVRRNLKLELVLCSVMLFGFGLASAGLGVAVLEGRIHLR